MFEREVGWIRAQTPAFHDEVSTLQCGPPSETALRARMTSLAARLGFESFSYGLSMFDPRPAAEGRTFTWTTLPAEWVALYERKRYVEIDPRLARSWVRTLPYIWDAAQFADDWQAEAFLRDAATFGIGSGVVVSFRDAQHARVVVALNASQSPVPLPRRAEIEARLGDVMLVATAFHDLYMSRLREEVSSRRASARLSPRERQCLQMAARGLTSADIGTKLGITERTANFHFSNVISKLGVINRHEAIARAVSSGMISLAGGD